MENHPNKEYALNKLRKDIAEYKGYIGNPKVHCSPPPQVTIKKLEKKVELIEAKPTEWFQKYSNLANAKTTYACCGGHGKAARNLELVKEYQSKLDNYPSDEVLYMIGIFNGDGST